MGFSTGTKSKNWKSIFTSSSLREQPVKINLIFAGGYANVHAQNLDFYRALVASGSKNAFVNELIPPIKYFLYQCSQKNFEF